MNLNMTLSKSQYIRGLQCHKSLWLYKNKPELRDIQDNQQESRFNTGYQVGDLAKKLFQNGVEIEFDASDFNGMIEKTKKFIANGTKVIYEATFSEDGIFAMVDILVKNGNAWDIYEVKASSHIKEYHINDTSIQWYALSKAINLNCAYVVHINNKYVRDEKLNIKELFAIDDITDIVLQKQANIKAQLLEMEDMLKGEMPDIDISDALLALNERFADLAYPFQYKHYYHPKFKGKYSIKVVLPTLFPDDDELDYKKLGSIQNGGDAMDTFANLHLLKDKSKLDEIKKDLLAYCRLDTLAMVRIWEKLHEVIK